MRPSTASSLWLQTQRCPGSRLTSQSLVVPPGPWQTQACRAATEHRLLSLCVGWGGSEQAHLRCVDLHIHCKALVRSSLALVHLYGSGLFWADNLLLEWRDVGDLALRCVTCQCSYIASVLRNVPAREVIESSARFGIMLQCVSETTPRGGVYRLYSP